MPQQNDLLWPYPSGLPTGQDWTFLHRIFGDLSKKLTWPFVGAAFTGTQALNITAINFTPIAGYDKSSLYRTATDRFYCPQDFNQYLAIGVCGAVWTTTGTNRTNLIWVKTGVNTTHAVTIYSDAATVRTNVPIMEPMNKGDYLTVSTASSGAGTDLTTARAFLVFIPLS